jgi:predicted molibdopterin-dependent oxidoreductase YjgC
VTLLLDGRQVPAVGSLLDTVLAAGVDLPHLCKDDNLPVLGACRTCVVEADGRIVAACSVPAASVKVVETATDRAVRVRRGVLELTAAMCGGAPASEQGGPHGADFAHSLARDGASGSRFEARPGTVVDASNPFFTFRQQFCILCGRCVAACGALQHIGAIGLAGRGQATRVTPGMGVSFRESICTSCGSCVAACPTPALSPNPGGSS